LPDLLNPFWIRNGLSYLQLQPPNSTFVSSDGQAGLGFREHRGFALVPGPPIGPPAAWPLLLEEFEQHCRGRGVALAFCGLAPFGRDVLQSRGYRLLKVGDEAGVPLDHLSLEGRQWRECRAALNRARRRDLTFEWVSSGARSGVLEHELHAVSEEWLAGKKIPELSFALGTHESLFDAHTRLGVARGPGGEAFGFVTWVPVPQQGGWMLDLMRQRPGAMAGLMDFLIVRSLLSFEEAGYRSASLGGVPLSNVGGERGGVLRKLMDLAFRLGGRAYQPASLLHFKSKFNPSWQPLYLACEARTHPALALLALVSASASTAGLAQFVIGNIL
jgi:phosphatidylglycerol lysyltransferase